MLLKLNVIYVHMRILVDLHEISPYATFSMSSGGAGALAGAGGEGGVRSCALHLRSFARDPLELAAPPPRPHLLAHPNGTLCALLSVQYTIYILCVISG